MLDARYGRLIAESNESALLVDIVRILSGGTPKTKNSEYWEDGRIPFFAPGDVTNSVYTLVTEKHITELGLDNCNSALYPVDTVFLTARGTVGKVAMAGRPMAMNQSCFAFAGINAPQTVVFQVIKGAVRSLKAKANGATFAAINTRDLKDEEVPVLSTENMAIYDEWAKPLHAMIRSNEEESLRLAELRDALLPKLMSGEIDVSKVDLTPLNNHLYESKTGGCRGHPLFRRCKLHGPLWSLEWIYHLSNTGEQLIAHRGSNQIIRFEPDRSSRDLLYRIQGHS